MPTSLQKSNRHPDNRAEKANGRQGITHDRAGRSKGIEVAETRASHDQEPGNHRFLYRNALVDGTCSVCFYCGAKAHLPVNCPSKQLPDVTDGLAKLGHCSVGRINQSFSLLLNTRHQDLYVDPQSREVKDDPKSWAHYGFYELKKVYQLRFFRFMWSAKGQDWNRLKGDKGDDDRGGHLWIGQDCLRVSNLVEAESFFEVSLKNDPHGFKPYCAMGFLNMEKQQFSRTEYYFNKALDHARTDPQKIYLLLLLSRLYELNNYPTKAKERISRALFIDRSCLEAIYQEILFNFRQGENDLAVRGLLKLIQQDSKYYVYALTDPDLAEFDNLVEPQLHTLFGQAKEDVRVVAREARIGVEEISGFLSEKDPVATEIQSMFNNLGQLLQTDSYLGYLDAIHLGESIVSQCKRSIEMRRRNLFEALHELRHRTQKYLDSVANCQVGGLSDSVRQRLMSVQNRIQQAMAMARTASPESFREIQEWPKQLSRDLKQLAVRVRRLEYIHRLVRLLRDFVRRNLILQTIVLLTALILPPLLIHYANITWKYSRISASLDLWFYQKKIILWGGLTALLIAFFTSIRQKP